MARATFYGFSIATSGLSIAQRNIDSTAHNITNADTKGYTRQRMVQAAIPAPNYISKVRGHNMSNNPSGGGVRGISIEQIRSIFLDRQFRVRNSTANYWDTKGTALYYLEDIFNATDETSLNTIMGDFFNAMAELHKNVTNKAVRTSVFEVTQKMTEMINRYYSRMEELMYEQDQCITESVPRINAIFDNIASLNQAIVKYELSGSNANDLRDMRNNLLDELSGYMDIHYDELGFKPPKYSIDGRELTYVQVSTKSPDDAFGRQVMVDKYDSFHIEAVKDHDLSYWGSDGLGAGANAVVRAKIDNEVAARMAADPTLVYADVLDETIDRYAVHTLRFVASGEHVGADAGQAVDIQSGALKGYLDIRDGSRKVDQGIPYFVEQLDRLVRGIVLETNKILREGYTVPYDEYDSVTGQIVSYASRQGVDFFDWDLAIPFTAPDPNDAAYAPNGADHPDYIADLAQYQADVLDFLLNFDPHDPANFNSNKGLTAATLNLSEAIKQSVYNIPASESAVFKDDPDHINTGENKIMLAFLELKGKTNLLDIGGFTEFYNSFLSEMGTEVGHSLHMKEEQFVLLDSVENMRLSYSGVSIDEEMTHLIRFQHAYNAAARMITTMDDALDVLINRTGRVGL